MARVNQVNTIIGTRGTGKTKFIQGDQDLKVNGIIPTYLSKHKNMKVLIVDTFDNPVWNMVPIMKVNDLPLWKKGYYRVFDSNPERLMAAIEKYIYNTAIFFEDATKIIGNKLNDNEKNFVIDSKQKNLDLWFIFHSLSIVPKDLIRVQDYTVLFKTNESWDSFLRTKYNNNKELSEAFERINSHESKYYNETILIGC